MNDEPVVKTTLPPQEGSTAEMAADSQPVARADSVPKPRDTSADSRARRGLKPFHVKR